ncbi:MAG: DUF3194 domain-containing protein [Candidatus Bathyarchaeota archaeon]
MEEQIKQKLSNQQIEEICLISEKTVRKHVLSKISPKKIKNLIISVETKGSKHITLTIEVNIALSTSMHDYDIKKLSEESIKEGFKSAEKYMRELRCR